VNDQRPPDRARIPDPESDWYIPFDTREALFNAKRPWLTSRGRVLGGETRELQTARLARCAVLAATSLGVDAVSLARKGGVSTFVDTGSAGPGNFSGFRTHVIEPSPVRIIAYLNVSFAGIYGFSRRSWSAKAAISVFSRPSMLSRSRMPIAT
jgi:hypothetical protein